MEKLTVYLDQLKRMRSMNRYYHDQFLLDVRILFILNTVFVFISLENNYGLYVLPLISLFGSVLLSFHAYFLIFSRQYSEYIELKINNELGEDVLIVTVTIGIWWFISGTGEKRLNKIFEKYGK